MTSSATGNEEGDEDMGDDQPKKIETGPVIKRTPPIPKAPPPKKD